MTEARPRVLQLFAPGINCDRELRYAFERAGAAVEELHVSELSAAPERILDFDLFAVPGGFSYGDDLGAGRVLALQIERRLGGALRELHARGGVLFGVCNGFQALLKAGFLPGVEGLPPLSLTWNASHRFECRWSRLRAEAPLGEPWPEGTVVTAVSAHAEGRIVLPDDERDAATLMEAGVVAFRYCDEEGRPRTDFPHCPSGSAGGIAGLVAPCGRILGLMPHPERNLSRLHLPDRGDGPWGGAGVAESFCAGLLSRIRTPASR